MNENLEAIKEIFGTTETLLTATIGVVGVFAIIVIGKFSKFSRNKIESMPQTANAGSSLNSELSISWKITNDEKKQRFKRGLVKTFIYIFPILISASIATWLKDGGSFYFPLGFVSVVIIGFGIVYLFNQFYQYKNRFYSIDSNNICVAKEKKKESGI